MPMGVTNGNAAFQRKLENLPEPVRDCAGPYAEDMISAWGGQHELSWGAGGT